MFVTKRTFFEALRLIKSKESKEDIEESIEKILKPKFDFEEFSMDLISQLNESALNSSRAINYFRGRGISENSMKKYLLGYSSKQDMVTVPISSPDGVYIGFVARSVEGKSFKNTPGLPKSKTLFNINRNKRQEKIFVVESSFDAIRIEQAGGYAVATLGASVSKEQKDLLKKYFSSIIVVSDNDEAGKTMAKKIASSLDNVIVASLPDSVKDVSDFDEESLTSFIRQFDDEISYILK
jgi:DNA primase